MRNTDLKKSLRGSGKHTKDNETKLIIKALIATRQPLTRRKLSTNTGLEIANLCRALFNLVYKSNTVVIAKYDYCATTGKLVMHFALNEGK